MRTVAKYAAPTPETRMPKPHACGVNSAPKAWSNHHAAATDTTNWNARMTVDYSEGAA